MRDDNNKIGRVLSCEQPYVLNIVNDYIEKLWDLREIAGLLIAFSYRTLNNHEVNPGDGIAENPLTIYLPIDSAQDHLARTSLTIPKGRPLKDYINELVAKLVKNITNNQAELVQDIYLSVLHSGNISNKLIFRQIMSDIYTKSHLIKGNYSNLEICADIKRDIATLCKFQQKGKLVGTAYVPSRSAQDITDYLESEQDNLFKQQIDYKDGAYFANFGTKVHERSTSQDNERNQEIERYISIYGMNPADAFTFYIERQIEPDTSILEMLNYQKTSAAKKVAIAESKNVQQFSANGTNSNAKSFVPAGNHQSVSADLEKENQKIIKSSANGTNSNARSFVPRGGKASIESSANGTNSNARSFVPKGNNQSFSITLGSMPPSGVARGLK